MKTQCAVLTVGNEIMSGRITDTNSTVIARLFASRGVRVDYMLSCGDDREKLGAAISALMGCCRVILITGGLGPTSDDLTTDTLAGLLGRSLQLNEAEWERIREFFRGIGRPCAEVNRKQAMFPEGAEILRNPIGTASGYSITENGTRLIVLPGVPREMERLLAETVLPSLRAEFPDLPIYREAVLHTAGIGESSLMERLNRLSLDSGVTVGTRASAGTVDVVLGGPTTDLLTKTAAVVTSDLADNIYDGGDRLPEAVFQQLRRRQLTLSTAESCTGGLIAKEMTDIPGVSAVFRGALVAYDNEVKQRQLGVSAAVLESTGAVSRQTVLAMAAGCARLFQTDCALAVSGVAGPGGGSPEKPVGTVWIAARRGKEEQAEKLFFPGTREMVRQRTVSYALFLLYRLLKTG